MNPKAKHYDVEQNSPAWELVRIGMVTASAMSKVCAKGRGQSESVQRARELDYVADELYRMQPRVTWQGGQMVRGHEQEVEACDLYRNLELCEGEVLRPGGFWRAEVVRGGLAGASPDALVYLNDAPIRGVEFKSVEGHIMQRLLDRSDPPPEHRLQVQTCMAVIGIDRWELCMYCPGYELKIFQIQPEKQAVELINQQVGFFYKELEEHLLRRFDTTLSTYRKRLDAHIEDTLKVMAHNEVVEERAERAHEG